MDFCQRMFEQFLTLKDLTMNTKLKNSLHIFLASKGGVGKTTIAAIASEWLMTLGLDPIVFDADAKNTDACISAFAALGARRLPLLRISGEGVERINEAGFEKLLDSLFNEDGPHVLDTGANTYTHLMSYVIDLGLVDALEEVGKDVYIHTVVAGGEMTEETVKGLHEIAAALPWPLVVWLNEFRSPAKLRGGTNFLDSASYTALGNRIVGIVKMKEVSPVQRDALDDLGPLHLLRSEIRNARGISAQKRIAFGSWASPAFVGLSNIFGNADVARVA